MYRDIALGPGSLWEWHLPRSSYYLDILLYFLMRAIGGDIHQGLALFAATQACLVVAGAQYALRAVYPQFSICLGAMLSALFLAVVHGEPSICSWLLGNMAHVLTFAAVLWGLGLFLRRIEGRRTLWPLILLVVITTWCDFVFVLWFVLPACAVMGVDMLIDRENRRPRLLLGAVLCAAVASGRVGDMLTRSYPAARLGSFKPHALWEYLANLAGRITTNVVPQAPLLALLWCAGFVALLFFTGCLYGEGRKRKGQRYLQARFAFFLLWSVLFNLIVMASYSMDATYYYLMFFYLPIFLGFPLAVGGMAEYSLRTGRNGPLFERYLAAVGAVGCVCLLVLYVGLDVGQRRGPLYPPLAECFDRLAASPGAAGALLSSYWNSHDRFFSHQAAFRVGHADGDFQAYTVNANPCRRPSVYDAVLVSPAATRVIFDETLVRQVNGDPDEIFACGPAAGKYAIWVYRNGAREMTPAAMLFDGNRVAPEFAKDDVVLWEGRHRFADGLTLTRVTTAERWYERWCVLEFADSPQALPGKEFGVSFIGDESPGHRRKVASWLTRSPDSLLAPLYRLFLHNKRVTGSETIVHALPDGGSALFFTIPARHSKDWPLFEVIADGERFMLNQPEH